MWWDPTLVGWRAAAVLQGVLATVAFVAIAFAPPAVGRTLLVPLDGKPIRQTLLDHSMLSRLAQGPLPGSVIVEGRGEVLASALFEQGILMLAVPAAMCREAAPKGMKADG